MQAIDRTTSRCSKHQNASTFLPLYPSRSKYLINGTSAFFSNPKLYRRIVKDVNSTASNACSEGLGDMYGMHGHKHSQPSSFGKFYCGLLHAIAHTITFHSRLAFNSFDKRRAHKKAKAAAHKGLKPEPATLKPLRLYAPSGSDAQAQTPRTFTRLKPLDAAS